MSVIDVFADRATPRARQTRPALFGARMAWAGRRLSSAPTEVAGLAVGDPVAVDLVTRTGLVRVTGVIAFWERRPNLHPRAVAPATLGHVRLDHPTPFHGPFVVRKRELIFPLKTARAAEPTPPPSAA